MLMDKDNSKKPNQDNSKKTNQKKTDKKKADAEITDALIQEALRSHLLKYSDKNKSKKKSLEVISSLMHEHLGSFIVLGYNYDGNPLSITAASNQQELDSLSALVHRFIMQNSDTNGLA